MARKCGIMTTAIRNSLVVRGAGERPAKSSLTSPGYALPECSPSRRAVAHLTYKYSKAMTGQSCCDRSIGLVAAMVLCQQGLLRLHQRHPRPHTCVCKQKVCHSFLGTT